MIVQFHNIITFVLISVIFSGIIAVPLINILYRLKVVRKIEVDFSTLIEERKNKYGTPIMGGLIFIITILVVNWIFNFNVFTRIPLNILAISGLLGAADDLLNIFGRPRKFRSLSRSWKLIKVHKSWWVRTMQIVLLPWTLYVTVGHMFESNPGTGLRAHEKLLIQAMIGGVLGLWVFKLFGGLFWIPLLGTFDIGWLIVPFAMFTFISMVNAVNISDGMDGLAAGMVVVNLLGFVMIAFVTNQYSTALLATSAFGALVTYLYFNISPARVQMGDTGSFALGALLTILAFSIGKPVLLIFICMPFIFEIGSTIIQSISRRLFGRRVFQMAPLHHHFEMIGWREDKVVVRFWLFAIVWTLLGLWVSFL
jgi:phospho-N-acetylmuramoyl-pentapeptide-transferase